MLQRVEEGDFPAPRRLNVNIPRPLEAICLKAMALRPKDRYQSPRQLADDLEKYLADEPVSAYQESALESAGRWMRKHRQRVLLGTALTFGLGALIIAALLVDRANRISRHEAELRTEELRTSLTTADSLAAQRIESGDFPGAVKLLDRALTQLGDRPGFDQLRAQLTSRRERTDRLATFHRLQRQLYAHQFSEEYDEAEAAAHACLKTLGITQDSSKWWQELPSDDLREPQAAELRDDVHGVILFLLYRSIQRGLFEFVWQNGDAENAYRSTPEVKRRMAEAQRYLKLANAYRESASTQYFGLVIRFALGDISPIAFLHQWITLKPREPAGAVDCFYTGVFYDITNVTILPNYAVFIQAARLLGSKTRLPDAGEEAERMYIEALLRRPDYFPACYKLADLLARKGDYAASVQTYNTCIQLQPDLALLYAGRGAALLARSHTVQDQTVSVRLEQLGQADLKYALKLSPDGAATLMKVGLTEARFGDLDAGCRRMLTAFDRMLPTRLAALGTTSFVPLRPQDDQFLRELESLSQRGAAPEQVAVLEAAFLASLDKWERVWDTLPKLSADHPWQPIALALRAEAALQLAGNDSNWQQVREGLTAEEVLSWSRDSFQGRPAHRPLRTAVLLLLRVNRPDEAFALLEQAEDDKASTAPWQQFELRHLKSRTLAALGRAADSHDLAEQARALNPLWFERAEGAGDR
jgi:tetratricopeptide (TPR) repeat protein